MNNLRDRILLETETSKQTIGRHGWIRTCMGGITRQNRTRLVIVNRNGTCNVYVNELLAHIVVLFMHDNFPEGNSILQQDGAWPHTDRVTQQFIADNNISLLHWASLSPDVSSIEHVWHEFK